MECVGGQSECADEYHRKKESMECVRAQSECAHEYQYMGTFLQSPMHHNVSATACSFRVPPPAAADFIVPRLRCSFPSLLHPHYQLVKEQCDAWILGVAQPPSTAARRLLLDCLIPRLICRNIPTAPCLLRLTRVTKMIAWLIIADDDDDLPDALGADITASTQKAALVMAILHCQNAPLPSALLGEANVESQDAMTLGKPSSKKGSKARALEGAMILGKEDQVSLESTNKPSRKYESEARPLDALAQLWEEMCIDMAPNLRTRFISTMADYLNAVKVQAAYRRAHRLPDLETYMKIRRQACFILPSFSLVEYAIGIELDEDVYTNPEVQKFRTAAVDHMCLCNDILSCRVEIGVGDYFNMPSIVYSTFANKEGCATFQEAINFVAGMVEELDAQLVSMVASIHQSPLPSLQCPSVITYVSALRSCISGSLAWYLETARYCNP